MSNGNKANEWKYDPDYIRELTEKVNEQEWGEGLSMEEVEAVLLAMNQPTPNPEPQKDILEKISSKVLEYANENLPKQITIPAFHDGAVYGYGLAQDQQKKTNEFICGIAKLLGEDDLGFDGKQWSIDDFKDAINRLTPNPEPQKEEGEVDDGLVMYDNINGDFIEIASIEDGIKYIRECYTDGGEIHNEFVSFNVYKKMGEIDLTEKDDVVTSIKFTPNSEPNDERSVATEDQSGNESWQQALRRMRDNDEFDDKFDPKNLVFIYAFQMGYRASHPQEQEKEDVYVETFYWESSLTKQPEEGRTVVVQYKTFEYDEIKYTKGKKDWFIKNTQCWLEKITPNKEGQYWTDELVLQFIKQFRSWANEHDLKRFKEQLKITHP